MSDRDLTGEILVAENTGTVLECVLGTPDRDGKRVWVRLDRGTYLLSDMEPTS